jgi:hypothetical protein
VSPTVAAAAGLFCVSLGIVAVPALATAADLARTASAAGQDPYRPAAPIGFASEFPRSPLEDLAVNGFQRFATPAAAQAHCPRDRIVAVPFFVNRYHPPEPDGTADLYMCRTDAIAEGDRPAEGR